jgi:hypothetical protein
MNERHKFKSGFTVTDIVDTEPANYVTETFDRDEAHLKAQLTAEARLLAGEIERGEDNAPPASQRMLNA